MTLILAEAANMRVKTISGPVKELSDNFLIDNTAGAVWCRLELSQA